MLRRSHRCLPLNFNGPSRIYSIKTQATLADSVLMLDWPQCAQELQFRYKCNFLPVKGTPLSVVKPIITAHGGSRLATCCVVTVADDDDQNPRSRWIPFIVDTGAPRALYLATMTWDLLGVQAQPRKTRSDTSFAQDVRVGNWKGLAFLSEEHGETETHLKDVNVIGMDLLGARDVAQTLTGILQRTLETLPLEEVVVTDGIVTLPVKPTKPTVMHLKKAIKAERPVQLNSVDADQIIIKEPDVSTGEPLVDEAPLRMGIKYIFEVPHVRK
jgi:hypothetical protein